MLLLAWVAHAASIQACEATLKGPDDTVRFTAYGADETEARASATRTGRWIADLYLLDTVVDATLLPERFATPKALLDADDSDVLRVPGWTLEVGACRSMDADTKATWPGQPPVVRAEPALALTAARRLACSSQFVEGFGTAFASVARAPHEDKTALLDAGLTEALGGLKNCVAATPKTEPSDSVATVVGGHSCRAYGIGGRRQPTLAVLAQGFGATLARAEDAAADNAVHAVLRRGFGEMLEARARASIEMRATMVAQGASRVLELPTSDLAERGAIACLAAQPTVMRWFRTGDCGRGEAIEAKGGTDATYQAVCHEGAYQPTPEIIRRAYEHASDETKDTLASSGWGLTGTCEVTCLAAATYDGDGKGVARRPGTPDRSTPEAARALLDQALANGDMDLFQFVVPMARNPRVRSKLSEIFAAPETARADFAAQMRAESTLSEFLLMPARP